MLTWLDQFWTAARTAVGTALADAIHYALRAVTSFFQSVLSAVVSAWNVLYPAFTWVMDSTQRFSLSMINWATYMLRHVIPQLARWSEAAITDLRSGINDVWKKAQAGLNDIYQRVSQAYSDIEQWAAANIFGPLYSFISQVWDNVKTWGYTAWWYITHPAALAELLIMPLTDSLETHAWDIAEKLGTFTLALIIKNLDKVVTLAEDIIEAVF